MSMKFQIYSVIGTSEANSAQENAAEEAGSNSTTPNQNDQSGWEVASGNESSESTPRNYASVVKSPTKTTITTTMTPMRLTTITTMTTTTTATSTIQPVKSMTTTTTSSKSTNRRKSSPNDGFSVVQRSKFGTKTKNKAAACSGLINFSDPSRYQALEKLKDNDETSDFESSRNRATTTPTSSRRKRNAKPRQIGRLRALARVLKGFFTRFSLLRFVSICFALFAVYWSFKFGFFDNNGDDELWILVLFLFFSYL